MKRLVALAVFVAACSSSERFEPPPVPPPITDPFDPRAIGPLTFRDATGDAGELEDSYGAGNENPGGGEPARGKADWYAPGILLADLDGDGALDIYLPRYDNERPELRKNLLYKNDGRGRFTDVTDRSGAGSEANSTAAVAGDLDGDGDLDLFVTNDLAPSHLYVNDGSGRFTDRAAEKGVDRVMRAFVASLVDFDHDGRLDIYVGAWDAAGPNGHWGGQGSHVAPNVLYHQRPDGTFEDVSARAGVECFGRSTLATGFADLDGDGFEDLYVANDFFDDCLYLNNGDGTFRDATAEWGAGPNAVTAMGVAYGDADNDQDLDLYVADDRLQDASIGNVFYRNDRVRFTSMAPELGLDGRFSWSTAFADFDADGWLDLFAATPVGNGPQLLFHNRGELRFDEIGGDAIGELRDARGAAVGDVDRDGRLDLVIALRRDPIALYLNATEPAGHHLRVRPIAKGGGPAIGATVRVESGGRAQVRTIVAGDGYRSQSELVAHFGLGDWARADRVEVRFPTGEEVVREAVDGDREIQVVAP
jgi:enediyne biosynthesis protein E4